VVWVVGFSKFEKRQLNGMAKEMQRVLEFYSGIGGMVRTLINQSIFLFQFAI
jgi:hypothetical protein